MGTLEKPVQLKVFIDKKKQKVMFAEAGGDFVDILFSFFTLPLGKIARLSEKHDMKVGSLTCLHESVVNLNAKSFVQRWYKDLLVNPRHPSASICEKLKVNLNQMSTPSVASCFQGDAELVKLSSFIIKDDLNVLPVTLNSSIALFNSLGVENFNLLEERTLYLGLEEFSNLLKWSLLTNNPLTNLVFGGGNSCSSSSTTNSSTSNNSDLISSTKTPLTLKLLVQKSNKEVLCAQVENPFVEILFSFLTIPLGAVIRLTKDVSPPSGINKLYNSVSSLGDGKYLKSDDVKTMLLGPKVAAGYHRVTDFLPIYVANTSPGSFLKEQAQFIVFNNLEVIASPSIATFLKFNTLGVPVGDLEVQEVSFGVQEALLLLKASLTSTSALTDFLNASSMNASRKKPRVESST